MKGRESGVTASDGTFYLFGTNCHRTKKVDKDGVQLTKSCHVCQDQHIKFQCQSSETCFSSFCKKCTDKYHPSLSFEEIMKCCPVCRGVCSCRRCLRKTHEPLKILPQDHAKNLEYVESVLKYCGPQIREMLELFDKQAMLIGQNLEDMPVFKPRGFAFTCDRCSTSISDFHFGCPECTGENADGKEICISCVAELGEAKDAERLEQFLTCNTCDSKLIPRRLISKQMLETLRLIDSEYGELENQPVMPIFHHPTESILCSLEVQNVGNEERIVVHFIIEVEMIQEDTLPQYLQKWECNLNATEGIEFREGDYGNSVPVVDFKTCTEENLYRLLELSIWRGEPFIVKNVHGKMDWRPQTMVRALCKIRRVPVRQKRLFSDDESEADYVSVYNCSKKWRVMEWSQHRFFKEYEKSDSESMYKIKDWPPDASFAEKLPRHNQDFIEMLPCPLYINPACGILNLTRALPEFCCRPDVGPKTYIATGRVEERNDNTDSVTKLHLDMSDAMNILLHSQKKESESSPGGAFWYVFSRKDIVKITNYLNDLDAICEKSTYLTTKQRDQLAQEYGVKIWCFYQNDNEAVYVPSGCPHQVRNTRSCLKVAVDFVPPQSAAILTRLTKYLREFTKRSKDDNETDGRDTLQGLATILYASCEAYEIKQQKKREFCVVKDHKDTSKSSRKHRKRPRR